MYGSGSIQSAGEVEILADVVCAALLRSLVQLGIKGLTIKYHIVSPELAIWKKITIKYYLEECFIIFIQIKVVDFEF